MSSRPAARRAGARRSAARRSGRSSATPVTALAAVDARTSRPATLRLAALATGIEGAAAALFAVLVLVGAVRSGRTLPLGPVLGLGAVFLAFGAALSMAGIALWRNHRRARSFAAVMHGLVVLVGLGFFPAGWRFGLAFLVVGGGGLAALFARPTARSLGEGRLPGR